MRKGIYILIILIISFSITIAESENQEGSTKKEDKVNKFKSININEYKNIYQISLTFKKEPVFNSFSLKKPFRIVADINNSIMNPPKKTININRIPFKTIKVAQHTKNKIRFVIELTKKLTYTFSTEENSLILNIDYKNENQMNRISNKANIKIAPRESSITLAEVEIGKNVKIINKKDNWYLILLPEGQSGWIKEDEIQIKDTK